jgi:hypothetical protein
MDCFDYLWTHPPRCIQGFEAQRADLPEVVFDGHGEELNTVFGLRCTCGHTTHFVLGHYWRNPDYNNRLVFLGPIALRCKACEKVTELIDTDIHGYDAELGHVYTKMREDGERAEFKCEACGVQSFEVYARFEYTEDLFGDDFEDFRGREQDLFSWFSLVGTCSSCSQMHGVADFECA